MSKAADIYYLSKKIIIGLITRSLVHPLCIRVSDCLSLFCYRERNHYFSSGNQAVYKNVTN
jgi:hypothetical protein